ncbi:MAG: hypothetical protein U0167_14585 [bacterium]
MAEAFSGPERDALVARCRDLWTRLYPPSGPPPAPPEFDRLRDRYYQGLAEYGDRLPRRNLGVCPFTGEPLLRSFDPFGVDGYWWHLDCVVAVEEPRAPAAFQVLLGALTLGRPAPTEAKNPVKPGPEVPFVVPALLELPGMQAVIGRVEMATGDVAWPISYWSPEKIEPRLLHQPWCRGMYWFETDSGQSAWSIANDVWDFDLAKWIAAGKLAWTDLSAAKPVVTREKLGFLDTLPGERRPQLLADGERDFLPLPDGSLVQPFGEPDDVAVPPLTPEEEADLEGDDDFLPK